MHTMRLLILITVLLYHCTRPFSIGFFLGRHIFYRWSRNPTKALTILWESVILLLLCHDPRKGEHMENAIDVIISISGLQDAGTPDNIEFVTCGKYSYEKNFIRISYMESEPTGLEGTQTTITITAKVMRSSFETLRRLFIRMTRSLAVVIARMIGGWISGTSAM